jgi:hypothetical protein
MRPWEQGKREIDDLLLCIIMSLLGIYRAREALGDMESLEEGRLVAGIGLERGRPICQNRLFDDDAY